MTWAYMVISVVIACCFYVAIRVFFDEIVARRNIMQRVAGKAEKQEKEPHWFHWIATIRDASGINMPFSRWLLLSLIGLIVGFILGAILLKNIIVGILLGVTLAAIPTWLLNYYAVQYREKVASGLIPAFETFYSEYTITRNVPKAMDVVARQAPEPAKDEFSRMSNEIYAGNSVNQVLDGFSRRMNNRWVRLFTALLTMKENRGSQIEQPLLNMIAEQKKRQMEAKKDRSELAQVRLVHLILMIGSIVLFLVNLVIRPDSYTFFTTTTGGRWALVFIVGSLLISLAIFMLMNRKELD
ncbi:type II secretion system F family protein [Lentibacillus salinarum]|uniref:Type II secretion system F family protein n=1 Tax=Lentibacillus salinarum TaxID=446820 RepID=A0ABW3ZWU8_9BACI